MGNYLWQSAGAGISILLLITFTNMVGLILIVAAGSTAFTVFGLLPQQNGKIKKHYRG